ncbi:MAG: hypothetical protein ABJE10_08135, partial [bacterium]
MTHAARGTTTQLRHIPFIEEVAALGDDDPSGLAARAGLLVLRLVDAWMEDGALAGGVDARAAMSARAAVEAMPAGQLTRGVLMNIVDVVRDSHARDVQAIGPRLMAYGRGLDLDAQWQLAVDVYDTVIEHVHVDEDRESAINALLRKGSCLRDLGRLADADGCYDTAIPLA